MMMRSCHPWEEPNTGDHNQADFLGEPVLKISTAEEKSKEYGETPNATVLFLNHFELNFASHEIFPHLSSHENLLYLQQVSILIQGNLHLVMQTVAHLFTAKAVSNRIFTTWTKTSQFHTRSKSLPDSGRIWMQRVCTGSCGWRSGICWARWPSWTGARWSWRSCSTPWGRSPGTELQNIKSWVHWDNTEISFYFRHWKCLYFCHFLTFCNFVTRIVVGFDLSFLSASTHNANRLRTVPQTAMALEMYPPNKKWSAGSIIFTSRFWTQQKVVGRRHGSTV